MIRWETYIPEDPIATDMSKSQLTIDVESEIKHVVQMAANANDMTVSEWLTEAVEEKLEDEDFSSPGPTGTGGFT